MADPGWGWWIEGLPVGTGGNPGTRITTYQGYPPMGGLLHLSQLSKEPCISADCGGYNSGHLPSQVRKHGCVHGSITREHERTAQSSSGTAALQHAPSRLPLEVIPIRGEHGDEKPRGKNGEGQSGG